MKPPNGFALVETIIGISILLTILFFSIQYSLLIISKQLVQWACYRTTRIMLPTSGVNGNNKKVKALHKAHIILNKIPLAHESPQILIHEDKQTVSTRIRQNIQLLGINYALHETFSMHK